VELLLLRGSVCFGGAFVFIFPLFFRLCASINIFPLSKNVAYCTGLLLARRVLKYRELDQEYVGNVEV
jgi:hypothetical protein